MARSYYAILGVREDESAEGIRSAFRVLAKLHHPDRAGSEGAERFREIREAYEVLADPMERQRYDERLLAARAVSIPIRRSRRSSLSVEPLIPDPIPAYREPEEARQSPADPRDRFQRDRFGREMARGGAIELLDLERLLRLLLMS